MSEPLPASTRLDLVERRMDLILSPRNKSLDIPTQYQRFHSEHPRNARWTSYASQRAIRHIEIDPRTGWLWLATWGGVLCWDATRNHCTRYTSEHGLIGNATRSVIMDRAGTIWAASQEQGLCSLSSSGWQPHPDFHHLTVLTMQARPQGGIYTAGCDTSGHFFLAELGAPENQRHLITLQPLACRTIEAMITDPNGTLWIGNVLGLHRYQEGCSLEVLVWQEESVRALASDNAGGLWIGTNAGLFHSQLEQAARCEQRSGWPTGEIISLSKEPDSNTLWIVTTQEVGCLINDKWQPVTTPLPGQFYSVQTTLSDKGVQIWLGGSKGVYEVVHDAFRIALTPDSEDDMSNATHALYTADEDVWLSTARGLSRFTNQQLWYTYNDVPALANTQPVVVSASDGRVWLGTWSGWLGYIQHDVYIPVQATNGPLIALTSGIDGTCWAATYDSVYFLPKAGERWHTVNPSISGHLGQRIIQAICYQQITGSDGEELPPMLWVGTSAGLLRYRSDLELWYQEPLSLPQNVKEPAIQAMSIDPYHRLWVGTSAGLFLYTDTIWHYCHKGDIRTLACSVCPQWLWLGTRKGLEQWALPPKGKLLAEEAIELFTSANSGLPSSLITSLATRDAELWIGSPAGVSCYRYQ